MIDGHLSREKDQSLKLALNGNAELVYGKRN